MLNTFHLEYSISTPLFIKSHNIKCNVLAMKILFFPCSKPISYFSSFKGYENGFQHFSAHFSSTKITHFLLLKHHKTCNERNSYYFLRLGVHEIQQHYIAYQWLEKIVMIHIICREGILKNKVYTNIKHTSM